MSMSYKDIIILLQAGYTKDEISGMEDQPQLDPQPAPQPQPDPQPAAPQPAAPQPDPQPDPQPADPQPDPQPQQVGMAEILQALQGLTAAVQTGNRYAADMGANIIDPIKAGQAALASLGNLKIKEDTK